jgi:hypothetical protein
MYLRVSIIRITCNYVEAILRFVCNEKLEPHVMFFFISVSGLNHSHFIAICLCFSWSLQLTFKPPKIAKDSAALRRYLTPHLHNRLHSCHIYITEGKKVKEYQMGIHRTSAHCFPEKKQHEGTKIARIICCYSPAVSILF